MTINTIQDEIIAEFEDLDEWMDRYSLIIDYGNELSALTKEEMVDDNLIDGCQAKVWIVMKEHILDITQGKNADNVFLEFKGNSDAILVRGIVALLLRVLSNHTPKEILEADLYFLDAIQLRQHLSVSRTNGLNAMLDRIRRFALSYLPVSE